MSSPPTSQSHITLVTTLLFMLVLGVKQSLILLFPLLISVALMASIILVSFIFLLKTNLENNYATCRNPQQLCHHPKVPLLSLCLVA